MVMNFDNIFNLQKMMMLVNHVCYQTIYMRGDKTFTIPP
jgi:hypothetical protein